MKLGTKCTVCGRRVDRAEFAACGQCDRKLHTACESYVTNYDCKDCGDERWVGALEF